MFGYITCCFWSKDIFSGFRVSRNKHSNPVEVVCLSQTCRMVLLRVNDFKSPSAFSCMLLGLSISRGRQKGVCEGALVADFFSPVNSRANCLFSYLSLAVNLQERWGGRWNLLNKTTEQEIEAGWKGSKPQKVADNRRQGGRRSARGRQRKRF